eukprot:2641029-Pyramimonas_sp.AAC.1
MRESERIRGVVERTPVAAAGEAEVQEGVISYKVPESTNSQAATTHLLARSFQTRQGGGGPMVEGYHEQVGDFCECLEYVTLLFFA